VKGELQVLDSKMIEAAINAAGFTEEEFTIAMKALRLQVSLSLKKAEISNLQDRFNTQSKDYTTSLSVLQQAATDIEAEIQKLASK